MTDSQRAKCHTIIHTASAAAGACGAGLAQIPGSDNIPITAIQITMTISLGKVFNISLTEAAAKTFVFEIIGQQVGKTVARVGTQLLIGWIPGIGNAVNTATAAGITEAMGWLIAKDFDNRV